MFSHSSAYASLSLTTHISTEGGNTYGLFSFTAQTIGMFVVAMVVLAIVALAVTISSLVKSEYQRPISDAVRTIGVLAAIGFAAPAVMLLLTWWTQYPWGVNDDNDFFVFIGSVISVIVLFVGPGIVFYGLFESRARSRV